VFVANLLYFARNGSGHKTAISCRYFQSVASIIVVLFQLKTTNAEIMPHTSHTMLRYGLDLRLISLLCTRTKTEIKDILYMRIE